MKLYTEVLIEGTTLYISYLNLFTLSKPFFNSLCFKYKYIYNVITEFCECLCEKYYLI